jgi:hydroxyacylglutathione hydrolase
MIINTSPLRVYPVRAFTDNYIWLIEAPRDARKVVAVDPGEAAPVLSALERLGASLAAILLTHHHADHIGGVAELRAAAEVPVFGPDDARIPDLTRRLVEGDSVVLDSLGLRFVTLHVPGHTLSHIAFHGHESVFCGDTLFSAGCGRLFEGTAAQMSASLGRLAALPAATRVYAGHEYTAANLRFAREVESDNPEARAYGLRVAQLRAGDLPTLPSTIGLETRVNPFLRCREPDVCASVAAHDGPPLAAASADPVAVFAALRAWKDGFRA